MEGGYSIGIVEIDDQHKDLVDLFSMIDTAITNREKWADVFFKLEQLREHARFHFAVEESLMRMHGYPGLAAHAGLHREFLAKLDQLQMTTLSRQVTMDTIQFLRNWYEDHMKNADREYVHYICRNMPVTQVHPAV